MTELGEGASVTVEEQPEKEEEKKKIKIRFSVFFDGTLNNRTNVREGAESQAYKDAKSSFGIVNSLKGVGSYENALSNVAKMEEYIDKKEGDYVFSAYIEGQGTTNYKADSFHGKALGVGESGVTQRARKGITRIIRIVSQLEGEFIIELLTVDVFGFSRGAAAARNFLYQAMNTTSRGRMPARPLKRRLESFGYEVEKVEIQFAGLYDTVSSVGLPNQHKHNSRRLHLDAISHAKEVVHLVAAEEHRQNFSLTNTNSAGSKEIYLPGVHSDIGAGYTDNYKEELIVYKGSKNGALAEENRLTEITGWCKAGQLELIEPPKFRGVASKGIYKLKLTRVVGNEYDKIPLHIMADFARQNEIKLKPILEDIYDIEDSSLVQLLEKLKSYASNRSSKVGDWHHNEQWLKDLRNQFLHFSAHYSGTGMEPRYVDGHRRRLIYEG